MVLTVAHTMPFFDNFSQMAISHTTFLPIMNEGNVIVDNLSDFEKDTIGQIADNLRRPGGRVVDSTTNAVIGATIPTLPCIFGFKSQHHLRVDRNLVCVL